MIDKLQIFTHRFNQSIEEKGSPELQLVWRKKGKQIIPNPVTGLPMISAEIIAALPPDLEREYCEIIEAFKRF